VPTASGQIADNREQGHHAEDAQGDLEVPANREITEGALKNREVLLILIHVMLNRVSEFEVNGEEQYRRLEVELFQAAVDAGEHGQYHHGGEGDDQAILQPVLVPILGRVVLLAL
jgi:hypothetical protein